MIIKEYITRLLFTIIISAAICISASALFFNNQLTFGLVLESLGLGIAIWLVSEICFSAVSKIWPHNILPSYVALVIIIAMGTGAGCWLFGLTSVGIILLICACAEVCGLLITVIFRRVNIRKLNAQLAKFKGTQK